MRWRIVLATIICVFAGPQLVVAQEHYTFWSFLEQGRPIARCAEKSPQHAAASQELEQLYEQFNRLKPSDNPTAAVEALSALLKTECFHLVSEIQELPKPDSIASLKDWTERGAFDWLSSYLEVPRLGDSSNLQPHALLAFRACKTLNQVIKLGSKQFRQCLSDTLQSLSCSQLYSLMSCVMYMLARVS